MVRVSQSTRTGCVGGGVAQASSVLANCSVIKYGVYPHRIGQSFL